MIILLSYVYNIELPKAALQSEKLLPVIINLESITYIFPFDSLVEMLFAVKFVKVISEEPNILIIQP